MIPSLRFISCKVEDGISSIVNSVVTTNSPVTSSKKVTTTTKFQGEALDKFRRSIKNLELPKFSATVRLNEYLENMSISMFKTRVPQ